MGAPKKFFWIGCAVSIAAFIGVLSIMGPQEMFASAYFALSNDTEYAPGYDDQAFRKIKIGDSETSVKAALGNPISESRPIKRFTEIVYAAAPIPQYEEKKRLPGDATFTFFSFDDKGELTAILGQKLISKSSGGRSTTVQHSPGGGFLTIPKIETDRMIKEKVNQDEIEKTFGMATHVHESTLARWLYYSRSPGSKDYHQRWIGLDDLGKVVVIRKERYFD